MGCFLLRNVGFAHKGTVLAVYHEQRDYSSMGMTVFGKNAVGDLGAQSASEIADCTEEEFPV